MTTATATETPAQIAEKQYDAFLSSPNLDPEWIKGWHAAVEKVTEAIASIEEGLVGSAGCPVHAANSYYDAYPVLSNRSFIAGWHSATTHIAWHLRDYADLRDWDF